MSELVLSASSVEAYARCHYRWYLSYVEKHAGSQSVPAAIGIAVHAGAEHYYKAVVEEGRRPDWPELVDVHDTAFWIEESSVPAGDPEWKDPVKARDISRRCLRTYVEDVASKTDPVLVEHGGRISVNGIGFSYHIDLADALGVVSDIKTTGSKPRDPGVWSFAATGYALGYRADTGLVESDIRYDVVIRLKRDRPYVVPYSNGGPATGHAVSVFAATLERAAEGIDKGDWRPTGLETGACKWCPYATICEYYPNSQ